MILGKLLDPLLRRLGYHRALSVPNHGWIPWGGSQQRLPVENLTYPYAFRLVPAIRACIELYQDRISALPIRFYTKLADGQREVIEPQPGNIAGAWATGNSEDTGPDIIRQLVGSRLIHGTAYLFVDRLPRSLGGVQFWVLNPPDVTIVPGEKRTVSHYLVKDGSQEKRYERRQIVRFPRYDPDLGYLGLSPLKALELAYESHRDAARMLRKVFELAGVLPGYFETEMPLTPDKEKELRTRARSWQGIDAMGDMKITSGKMVYKRAALDMQELMMPEVYNLVLKDMLRVFKIPPSASGIIEGSGLNSDVMGIAEMQLHQNAIDPECRSIASVINERLLSGPEFAPLVGGGTVECEFDYSGVRALQDAWLKEAQGYQIAVGAPILTIQEARMRLGLPSEPEEGELLQPLGMITPSQAEEFGDPREPDEEDDDFGEDDERVYGRIQGARRRRVQVSHERSLMGHTERTRRGIRKLFARQRRRAHAALDVQLARAVDIEALVPLEPDDEGLIRALLEAVVKQRGPEAIAEIGLQLAFRLSTSEVRAWLRRNAAEAITQINATTKARLVKSLDEGVAAQETLGQLHARVDAVFGGRRRNALTIARTETTPAFNFASQEAWRQTGVVEEKEWLSARDEHVRESHVVADGQRVGLQEDFTIGGDRMQGPGEGSIPDENINCRCTVIAVVGERSHSPSLTRSTNRVAVHLNGNGGAVIKWGKPHTNGHVDRRPLGEILK